MFSVSYTHLDVYKRQTLVMKTWGSAVIDDLLVLCPAGMKAALGENPKRVYGSQNKMPKTRMGNAAMMRKALTQAKDYLRKKESSGNKPEKLPDFDQMCIRDRFNTI